MMDECVGFIIRRGRVGSFVCAIAVATLICGSAASSAEDCASGMAFTGPITITRGGTYTGNWESVDQATPVVQIFTTERVTITQSHLRGPGDLLITSPGADVTVRESCFVGTYPIAAGTGKGNAMHFWRPANVIVEHNDLENVGGYVLGSVTGGAVIWVQEYSGNRTLDNTVKIRFNRFRNLDGRISDGMGGYLTTHTSQWSTGIHPSNVSGVPSMEIAWNQIINEPYRSGIGDSINIFDTSGTAESPMRVHDNYIQGGWDSGALPVQVVGFRWHHVECCARLDHREHLRVDADDGECESRRGHLGAQQRQRHRCARKVCHSGVRDRHSALTAGDAVTSSGFDGDDLDETYCP
jgi:hypothetical protein